MEIQSTPFKHCDLIQVTGRIDSSTAPKLDEAVNHIFKAGRYKIVFDFSGVDFLSSAGLRVLISAQKSCKRYNRGEVVLAAVPQNIQDALDLAGFTMLFKFFSDNITGVGNF